MGALGRLACQIVIQTAICLTGIGSEITSSRTGKVKLFIFYLGFAFFVLTKAGPKLPAQMF